MEKINILEILKDCPKGMELDCALYNNCTFEGIEDVGYINILVKTPNGQIKLSKEGCIVHNCNSAKCVIFPKGKTTWEGFQRPFKDGDILTNKTGKPFILKAYLPKIDNVWSYCGIDCANKFNKDSNNWTFAKSVRFATEEEKEKLFKAIKDNGYKWNAETKTLEKLTKPKFKVVDRVKHISAYTSGIVVKVTDKGYHIDYPKGEGVCYINFTLEKDYELAPNKFDITTLKPFEGKVLIRDTNTQKWEGAFYSHHDAKDTHPYHCILFGRFKQCIPFEGNEHLLGKTDDCDEYYKTWE